MPKGQSRPPARGVAVACALLWTSLVVIVLYDWINGKSEGASVYIHIGALSLDGQSDETTYVLVYVDGKLRGRVRSGNGFQVWLEPGRHTVMCTSPGFQTCTEAVVIKPSDSEAYVYCELKRKRSGCP